MVPGVGPHCEDRSICGCEAGPLELSPQNEDLMALRQDLDLTRVTTHKQQPHTGNQKPKQMRKDR